MFIELGILFCIMQNILAPVSTLRRNWFSDSTLQPVLVLDALLPEDAVLPGQLVPLRGLLHVVPVSHKYL